MELCDAAAEWQVWSNEYSEAVQFCVPSGDDEAGDTGVPQRRSQKKAARKPAQKPTPDGDTGVPENDAETRAACEHYLAKCSLVERCRGLRRAAGFNLKTRAAGWKLFCERRHLPPSVCWEYLPGYARVKRDLEFVADASPDWPDAPFTKSEMVEWMNSIRDQRGKGGPDAIEENIMSRANYADNLDTLFAMHVKQCGG